MFSRSPAIDRAHTGRAGQTERNGTLFDVRITPPIVGRYTTVVPAASDVGSRWKPRGVTRLIASPVSLGEKLCEIWQWCQKTQLRSSLYRSARGNRSHRTDSGLCISFVTSSLSCLLFQPVWPLLCGDVPEEPSTLPSGRALWCSGRRQVEGVKGQNKKHNKRASLRQA